MGPRDAAGQRRMAERLALGLGENGELWAAVSILRPRS